MLKSALRRRTFIQWLMGLSLGGIWVKLPFARAIPTGSIRRRRRVGSLWAWGTGTSGQLGDGTIVNKSLPVQIGVLTNWSKVAAGASHTVAVKTDGTLWAWGYGSAGRLGNGGTTNRSSPVQIGANWSHIAAGDHTVALK